MRCAACEMKPKCPWPEDAAAHQILGVPWSVEPGDPALKSNYRKLCMQYHPDKARTRSKEERAAWEAIMTRINVAYDVLTGKDRSFFARDCDARMADVEQSHRERMQKIDATRVQLTMNAMLREQEQREKREQREQREKLEKREKREKLEQREKQQREQQEQREKLEKLEKQQREQRERARQREAAAQQEEAERCEQEEMRKRSKPNPPAAAVSPTSGGDGLDGEGCEEERQSSAEMRARIKQLMEKLSAEEAKNRELTAEKNTKTATPPPAPPPPRGTLRGGGGVGAPQKRRRTAGKGYNSSCRVGVVLWRLHSLNSSFFSSTTEGAATTTPTTPTIQEG